MDPEDTDTQFQTIITLLADVEVKLGRAYRRDKLRRTLTSHTGWYYPYLLILIGLLLVLSCITFSHDAAIWQASIGMLIGMIGNMLLAWNLLQYMTNPCKEDE